MKKFVITYNSVVLATLSTQKDAKRFLKTVNKNFASIRKTQKEIIERGGQPSSMVYLDMYEGDYIYPISQKEV